MIKKRLMIGVSILAVVLLVLGSLSNVVGYQSVQTSQQNTIKERINQRELLFQTIVDIANNKEIQRIILKFQMGRGIFPTSEFPVVTKNQIKMMYFIGLILSKVISKSTIQSLIGKYQFNNQEIQKEINAVIEKDTIINSEITQLQNSECDCENQSASEWRFPVVCFVLMVLFYSPFIVLGLIDIIIGVPTNIFNLFLALSYIPWSIGYSLGCRFAGFGPGTR
ncbi:MAG: hypothetical protein MUC80_00985 [Candidatus Thermoplasmatota archaeon]|jgi:hypothetical protein|nr:hypothetical protein [Candidatus Thermoplasmatota archaeon]